MGNTTRARFSSRHFTPRHNNVELSLDSSQRKKRLYAILFGAVTGMALYWYVREKLRLSKARASEMVDDDIDWDEEERLNQELRANEALLLWLDKKQRVEEAKQKKKKGPIRDFLYRLIKPTEEEEEEEYLEEIVPPVPVVPPTITPIEELWEQEPEDEEKKHRIRKYLFSLVPQPVKDSYQNFKTNFKTNLRTNFEKVKRVAHILHAAAKYEANDMHSALLAQLHAYREITRETFGPVLPNLSPYREKYRKSKKYCKEHLQNCKEHLQKGKERLAHYNNSLNERCTRFRAPIVRYKEKFDERYARFAKKTDASLDEKYAQFKKQVEVYKKEIGIILRPTLDYLYSLRARYPYAEKYFQKAREVDLTLPKLPKWTPLPEKPVVPASVVVETPPPRPFLQIPDFSSIPRPITPPLSSLISLPHLKMPDFSQYIPEIPDWLKIEIPPIPDWVPRDLSFITNIPKDIYGFFHSYTRSARLPRPPYLLLPAPLPEKFQKPITVVVPLELISQVHPPSTRTGLENFLLTLSQFAEIVLVSNTSARIAKDQFQVLDPLNIANFRLTCEHWAYDWRVGEKYAYQPFERDLVRLNRDLSKVVVLDETLDQYPDYKENVLIMPNRWWRGDMFDTDLLDILPVLAHLSTEARAGKDMREVLKYYRDVDPAKITRRVMGRKVDK